MKTDRLVLVAEQLDDDAFAWLNERVRTVRAPLGSSEFDRLLPEAHGLVVRSYARVDAAFLRTAPSLQVIGRAGVALDRIDLEACANAGVCVVHTPAANAQAVTELVYAFLHDAIRYRAFMEVPPANAEDWNDLREELTSPRQLSDCTLGVLGLGQIGQRVARVASAFNIETLYHDVREIPLGQRSGATPVSLQRLFEESDIISIHVDNRQSNKHLVNGQLLGLLPSDAIVINTSRGFVVDTLALAAFLRDNPDSQAILDVHDPEPITQENPLLALDNACLSPHIGAATRTAHASMSRVVEDVYRVLVGESPVYSASHLVSVES